MLRIIPGLAVAIMMNNYLDDVVARNALVGGTQG
jgi:hypothetical protein